MVLSQYLTCVVRQRGQSNCAASSGTSDFLWLFPSAGFKQAAPRAVNLCQKLVMTESVKISRHVHIQRRENNGIIFAFH